MMPNASNRATLGFGWSGCSRFLVVFLLVLLFNSGHSARALKPSCMQSWLAKAGVPQPDVHVYEGKLLARNVSVPYLSGIGHIRGVEAILHFAGIGSASHRRLIATCVLNGTSACMKSPCLHGGQWGPGPKQSVASGPVGYICRCPARYEGAWCELESCLLSTCKNGGSCSGAARRLLCRCPPGWKGSRCQIPQNECLSRPCKNGASCQDTVAGYQCVCVNGFKGADCGVQAQSPAAKSVGVDKQMMKAMNGSVVSLQKTVDKLQMTVRKVDAWIRRLWCSGGDAKNSKYGFYQDCHYCLYRKRRNFKDAMNRCRMRGSDLVSIHSRGEELFSLKTFGGGFWLGGHDKFVEGLWQWTDSTQFIYANWVPGQPSNSQGREHCAAAFGAGWADDPCRLKRSYVCKICP